MFLKQDEEKKESGKVQKSFDFLLAFGSYSLEEDLSQRFKRRAECSATFFCTFLQV